MMRLRKSGERALADHGWLVSRHTFSFADYYDPNHMGFGVLRVINEDQIEGGSGFPTHAHRDMEIISYVIDGALEHADSMGNRTIIRPGEIQRMSAGTGVRHSEYNHYKDRKSHFLQIWILPEQNGVTPSYGQMDFAAKVAQGGFVLLTSRTGRDGSIAINQDADIYLGKATSARQWKQAVKPNRYLWVQMVKGGVVVNGQALEAGDGLAMSEISEVAFEMEAGAEFLFFDMVP